MSVTEGQTVTVDGRPVYVHSVSRIPRNRRIAGVDDAGETVIARRGESGWTEREGAA